MADLLYGRNAVHETFRAQRRTLKRLWIATGAQETGVLQDIIHLADNLKVPVERVDRHVLTKRLHDINHQGVMLEASDYPYVEIEDCLALAEQQHALPLLLMLDHVQDPQNIGTLLRTAEAVGVHGIILPSRRSATITPAVVNASSGATEHLQIALVSNLAQSIAKLQQHGIWVVGVENDEHAPVYDQTDLNAPVALIIGAEGTGLARLTRERCDYLVRLPMYGRISSLNAAVSGSIVLYYARQQRTYT